MPPAPLPRLPGVPAAVAAICNRCLAKDPAARPTAAEAERLLTGAAGRGPTSEPPALEQPAGSPGGEGGQRTAATQPIEG